MWFKYPIIVFSFIFLALFQNSFLSYFTIVGFIPNLLFALFFIIVFLEESTQFYEGIFTAILAGFAIDLFMPFYFGGAIFSLLLVYIFIKTILYFLRERKNEYLLLYFIPIFLISFAMYKASVYTLLNFPHLQFNIDRNNFIELTYNLILALVMLLICLYANSSKRDRQLTLFR